MKGDRPLNELRLRLGTRRIGDAALDGADGLTRFFGVKTDALCAALLVDDVNLPPLRDRVVGALGLAGSAVDAIGRNEGCHGGDPKQCACHPEGGRSVAPASARDSLTESYRAHVMKREPPGGPVQKITASQVMTRNVLAVGADWSIDRLLEFLTEHSISGAPVVSGDHTPIGVVSLTDLARNGSLGDRPQADVPNYYRQGLEKLIAREEMRGFHVEAQSPTTVREVMTPVVFGVDESSTVQEVADAMITGRIHRVLVTRKGKMVGIISSMDLLPIVRDLAPPPPKR